MGWGCGQPAWGFGPLFPVLMVICMVVMLAVAFRVFGGRDGRCGFGRYDEVDELRKEVGRLKGEIEALRKER